MHPELQSKLEEYRVLRAFNPSAFVDAMTDKLNAYMQRFNLKACVTSVSGGIDSAVVLALCSAAMTKAQEKGRPVILKNVGVCQPIASSAWALERGRENIAACPGAMELVVDQTSIYTQLYTLVEEECKKKEVLSSSEDGSSQGSAFARGQLRSYMRTPVGYYVAQILSQQGTPAIVMGTGNKDEDGYLGYFCKAGDGVVDVQLISSLHKSEVFLVAHELKVPENTRKASPSADLWDGQTDEEELGFTYDFVELYTGFYLEHLKTEDKRTAFVESLSAEAKTEWERDSKACEGVHRRNAHKLVNGGIVNL